MDCSCVCDSLGGAILTYLHSPTPIHIHPHPHLCTLSIYLAKIGVPLQKVFKWPKIKQETNYEVQMLYYFKPSYAK